MKKEAISLLGVGDILIEREKPETMFQYVAKVLSSADITYGNCEQMYSNKGSVAPGGHATYSDPKNITALLYAGFDVVSLANNNTLSLGPEALFDTKEDVVAAREHCNIHGYWKATKQERTFIKVD